METNRSSASPPMIILGPWQVTTGPAQQQQLLYQPATQQNSYQQVPQQIYQQIPRQQCLQISQQSYQPMPQPIYQQVSIQHNPSLIYQTQQFPQRTFSNQVSSHQSQQHQQPYRQLQQHSNQSLPQLQVQQFNQAQQPAKLQQQPLLIQCYRFDDFDGDLSSLVVSNGNQSAGPTIRPSNAANSQKRPLQSSSSRDADYTVENSEDFDEEDSDSDDETDDESGDNDSEIELDVAISQLLASHRPASRSAPSLAVQSAYALFFKDTLPQVKRDQPAAAFGEASRTIERMWSKLSQAGKATYAKRSAALRSNKPYSLPVPVKLGHRPEQLLQETQYEAVRPAASKQQTVRRRSEATSDDSSKSADQLVKKQRKLKQPRPSTEAKKPKQIVKKKKEKQKDLPLKKPKKFIVEEAGVCARHGCSKPSIDNPQWDGEYCSADCCLLHVGQVRLLFAGMSAAAHAASAS